VTQADRVSTVAACAGGPGRRARRGVGWPSLRPTPAVAIYGTIVLDSALVEAMVLIGLTFYARTCGWTLARAHA